MASGHRKRKADLIRKYVLTPQGLTNVSEADRGAIANQNNLVNIAISSKGGFSPTFTNASTTLLSDAVSNAAGIFSKASLTGETTNVGLFTTASMSGAIGLQNNALTTKHYYFPAMGTQTDLSSSAANTPASPVIIYSYNGPQADYVPYYLGGTLQTASMLFNISITGAAANSPTHVVVYVGGELAAGDSVNICKANATTTPFGARVIQGSQVSASNIIATSTTASATDLSANLYRKAFLIPTGSVASAQGICVQFSSSAKTITTPASGLFVVISSASFGAGVA
jgi:hypothetical protein